MTESGDKKKTGPRGDSPRATIEESEESPTEQAGHTTDGQEQERARFVRGTLAYVEDGTPPAREEETSWESKIVSLQIDDNDSEDDLPGSVGVGDSMYQLSGYDFDDDTSSYLSACDTEESEETSREVQMKQWKGLWDIVLMHAHESNTGRRVEARRKRRKQLIARMRSRGLIVVPQLSTDGSFVMLKITARSEALDREALRTSALLPLRLRQRDHERPDSVFEGSDSTGPGEMDGWSLPSRGRRRRSTSNGFGRLVDILRKIAATASALLPTLDEKPLIATYMPFESDKRYLFDASDRRFYSSADRQLLIMSILRARHEQGGCGIDLDKEINDRVISKLVPLHDIKAREALREGWLTQPLADIKPPIDSLRRYFGESVALYFLYIAFYTKWLVYLAVPGVLTFLLCMSSGTFDVDHFSAVAYGFYICMWCAFFIEAWKRQQHRFAFRYHVTDLVSTTDARPKFRGEPVAGRITRAGLIKYKNMDIFTDEDLQRNQDFVLWYSPLKRFTKYALGAPVLGTFVVAVVAGTLALLWLKTVLESEIVGGGLVASSLNGLFIVVMDQVYKVVAEALNEWENHRTAVEYENARVAKVFIFQFINSYLSLFFIAFVKNDPIPTWAEGNENLPEFSGTSNIAIGSIDLEIGACNYSSCMLDLTVQLAAMIITKQLASNIQEVGLPWARLKLNKALHNRRRSKMMRRRRGMGGGGKGRQRVHVAPSQSRLATRNSFSSTPTCDDDSEPPRFERECLLPCSEGTFEEYNELLIQFGYMTMFATSFPLASIVSLLNNVFELKIDGRKMLFAVSRAIGERTNSIGTWLQVLTAMSYIAVPVNLCIVFFTSFALRGRPVDRTSSEYLECARLCQADARVLEGTLRGWRASEGGRSFFECGSVTDATARVKECLDSCSCEGLCLSIESRLVAFVVLEHVLVLIKYLIDMAVSDVPGDVLRATMVQELTDHHIKLVHLSEEESVNLRYTANIFDSDDEDDEMLGENSATGGVPIIWDSESREDEKRGKEELFKRSTYTPALEDDCELDITSIIESEENGNDDVSEQSDDGESEHYSQDSEELPVLETSDTQSCANKKMVNTAQEKTNVDEPVDQANDCHQLDSGASNSDSLEDQHVEFTSDKTMEQKNDVPNGWDDNVSTYDDVDTWNTADGACLDVISEDHASAEVGGGSTNTRPSSRANCLCRLSTTTPFESPRGIPNPANGAKNVPFCQPGPGALVLLGGGVFQPFDAGAKITHAVDHLRFLRQYIDGHPDAFHLVTAFRFPGKAARTAVFLFAGDAIIEGGQDDPQGREGDEALRRAILSFVNSDVAQQRSCFKLASRLVSAPRSLKLLLSKLGCGRGTAVVLADKVDYEIHSGNNYVEVNVDLGSSASGKHIGEIFAKSGRRVVVDLAFSLAADNGNGEGHEDNIIAAVRCEHVSVVRATSIIDNHGYVLRAWCSEGAGEGEVEEHENDDEGNDSM